MNTTSAPKFSLHLSHDMSHLSHLSVFFLLENIFPRNIFARVQIFWNICKKIFSAAPSQYQSFSLICFLDFSFILLSLFYFVILTFCWINMIYLDLWHPRQFPILGPFLGLKKFNWNITKLSRKQHFVWDQKTRLYNSIGFLDKGKGDYK